MGRRLMHVTQGPEAPTRAVGLGTVPLRPAYDAVAAGNGRVFVSGMSSKVRGVTAADLAGKSAEMAVPDRLVA